jgi:hypothetical protein
MFVIPSKMQKEIQCVGSSRLALDELMLDIVMTYLLLQYGTFQEEKTSS